MHKKIFYLAGILLGLIFSFQISLAQETESAEAVLIADVNIYEAKIVSQDKNKFELSFNLSNGKGIQSGIGYTVSLIKDNEEKGQIMADEKVYPRDIQLKDNQVIKESVQYIAPEYLGGEYDLWIFAKNEKGLSLAISSLGKVKLNGDNQYLEIINNSCYMTVGDEDIKYGPRQGVDIKQGEKLFMNCEVQNNFDSKMEVTPNVKTFWRSTSGEEINNSSKEDKIMLEPKGKKKISVELVIPSEPQAYEVRLSLLNNQGNTVSNEADAHYVLSGASATIQNITLDKNYYQKGDKAKLSFFWSGSADGFFGSRMGNNGDLKYFIQAIIQDGEGNKCAKDINSELDKDKTNPEFDFLIDSECQNPTVLINLKDEKGNILDESDAKIKSDSKIESSLPIKSAEAKRLIFIIFVIIILVTLLTVIFRKKTGLKAIIFFLLISGMLFFNYSAKAAPYSASYRVWTQYGTSSNSGANHNVTMTPSLDKVSYNPGETITASIAAFSADCNNSYIDYALGMRVNGTESKRGGYFIQSDISGSDNTTDARVYAYSKTFTAPSSPGNYQAVFFYEDKRCKPLSYGGRLCYFDNGVYVGNKTSQVNYNVPGGVAPYGTSWTAPQMWTALKNYGGIYKHYNDYHVSENVWGCMANCSVSEVSTTLNYTVVSSPPPPPPPAPSNCNLPWGGTISSGSSVPAYQVASVPSGNTCPPPENRVCNNGILSGTFVNQSCVVSGGAGGYTPGVDSLTINTVCTEQDFAEFCDSTCGSGNRIQKHLNSDCSVINNNLGPCLNLPPCPGDIKFEEVSL